MGVLKRRAKELGLSEAVIDRIIDGEPTSITEEEDEKTEVLSQNAEKDISMKLEIIPHLPTPPKQVCYRPHYTLIYVCVRSILFHRKWKHGSSPSLQQSLYPLFKYV